MASWPLQDSSVAQQGGALVATSVGTNVTCGAAHVKGAWAELIASTDIPASELIVHSTGALFTAATDTSAMFDIAIGASTAEVVVVADVLCGYVSANTMWSWRLPLGIPKGSRVAMRAQCAVASKVIEAQAFACGGGFVPSDPGGRAVTYGAVTGSSSGTLLATPGAVNTKAAWTVLSAATSAPARFALVTVQPVTGTTVTAGNSLVDVGVGAATAEQVIIPNIVVKTEASERVTYSPMLFPVSIAAGSRLVARQQSSVTTATSVPRVVVTLFS